MKKIVLLSLLLVAKNLSAQSPTDVPIAPTANAADVISIYSDAYTDVATKPWNPNWGQNASLAFDSIVDNEVAVYTNLDFTGIEPTATIDLTNYTHFNVSYWTAASLLKVKLVDWGANGAWNGGGDDTEHEIEFTPTPGEWNYLSIPIADFIEMTSTEHFAQLIFASSGANATVYIDDIYFSKQALLPTDAAIAPTTDTDDVISIYSDVYTDVATNPWNPSWGQNASLAFDTIADNEVAVYSNLDFTGIEPTTTIDLNNYTHFNVSYWTVTSLFKLKLVDWGADGIWSDGGDDTEHEFELTPTAGKWNYLSIPIADFSGMTSTEHFAQLIFASSDANATVYIDDIYFSMHSATEVPEIEGYSLEWNDEFDGNVINRVNWKYETGMAPIMDYQQVGEIVKSRFTLIIVQTQKL